MTQAGAIKSTGNYKDTEEQENIDSKSMKNTNQHRNKTLQEINTWLYQRTSHLSITGHDKAAQALTEEHMESLQDVNPEKLLWIKN